MEGLKPPKSLLINNNVANEWKLWQQQFKYYSTATGLNKKDEQIKVATLMTCIGADATKLADTFNIDDKTTLEQVIQKFTEVFTPKSNFTYERFIFNNLKQEQGESFDEFLTKCKLQLLKCNFDNITPNEILKDKVIMGIIKNDLRQKLLSNDKQPLDEVISTCKTNEITLQQVQSFKNETVYIVKNQISNSEKNKKHFNCNRCKTTHGPKSCPAFGKMCVNCKKKGHFSIACRSKNKNSCMMLANIVVSSIDVSNNDGWFEDIMIKNVSVKFKIDTGAMCNVLYKSLLDSLELQLDQSNTKSLEAYGGHLIKVIGEKQIKCSVKNKDKIIKFKIIEEEGTPITGFHTAIDLGLVKRCDNIEQSQSDKVSDLDDDIFNGIGKVNNFTYDIDLIPDPKFIISPPRRIAYSIREEVKKQLDNMVKWGIIKKITEPTPVVSPLVAIKQRGKLRICIDPSNLNQNILRRHYPLKTIDEIATNIKGAKYFTILDCLKGFWQIPVTQRTEKYLPFATPWGRYTCLRLPFGLASAPEIFQELMTSLLENIQNVEVSMDDILIHDKSLTGCQETTKKVIEILRKTGFKLNREKCLFNKTSIKFLGHKISQVGLEIDEDKIRVINNMNVPKTVKQVQRLMGMINYVSKFIPNCSEVTAPIRDIMRKDIEFNWGYEQQNAFENIKNLLKTTPVLKYYDTNKRVKLSVDASKSALGAVLMQDDHPVAYASRSLSKAEIGYPQIEKEATAIRFACKKFHTYIYGKELEVETDHKPLESIFKKPLGSAPPRLQRIMFEVSQYSPRVIYKKGKEIPIPDLLSRDIENAPHVDNEEEIKVHLFVPLTNNAADSLIDDYGKESYYKELVSYIIDGWPEDEPTVHNEIKHFSTFKDELSIYGNIIFERQKIVVPRAQIGKIITQAHAGHSGQQSTIRLIRSSFYWKALDKDVINYIKRCSVCEQTQRSKTKEPITTKTVPELPFQIVATDLFSYNSKTYIVMVDSYN